MLTILIVGASGLLSRPVGAMDPWAALSMIESGNNDRAVGTRGEISRFQIRPELWPGGNPKSAQEALFAAREIMLPRLEQFQETHKRVPTAFEFYVLWNAPWEVDHPSAVVMNRASRYSNLVQR
jgi:hypothetical protein